MKILASTKIQCPAEPKHRHEVTLRVDGSVTCDCPDGSERGSSYAGRLLLGMPAIEGARGCAVLAALVDAAPSLLTIANGSATPEYGPWGEAIFAYGKNPVYRAALDRAAQGEPERAQIRQLVMEGVERAGYKHTLGKRRFREEFRALWDVPVNDGLHGLLVSAFDDDEWAVPYMPGWKEQIADQGLAVVDGKFVVGRSPEDPKILYAITPTPAEGHWIRRHELLRGGKLRET